MFLNKKKTSFEESINRQNKILNISTIIILILSLLKDDPIMLMLSIWVVYLSELFKVKYQDSKDLLTKLILWCSGILSLFFLITVIYAFYIVFSGQSAKYLH